jgi:hypothetical protein
MKSCAGEFEIFGALATVTGKFGRVSIHGVRQEILRAQREAAGQPQLIVPIPYPCPNEIYEARLGETASERPPREPSRMASPTRSLAICSSTTSAPIANRNSPVPTSRRYFRIAQLRILETAQLG